MAVDLSKVMDLADGLEIYKDLRDRIKNIPVPEVPVVGLLINNLEMPINDNKYIKFGVQNGISLVMNGAGTAFNLEADLRDVQINGVSIRSQGVANIPMGNASQLGVFKISNNEGIGAYSDGRLSINEASSTQIKAGSTTAKPIVPGNQHQSVFYGLTKAAGVDMAQSNNAVGTYTDEAKQAIQKMLGLDGILGDFENSAVASKAYAIGETFVYNGKRYRATAAIAISDVIAPGTNCVLDPIDGRYVKNTDVASDSVLGLTRATSSYGIYIKTGGYVSIDKAVSSQIKAGANEYRAIVPYSQHESAFYGLAKAAGVDLANETVTVGTYPATAKAAILDMLGAVKDVQANGTSILVNGVANIPIASNILGLTKYDMTDDGYYGVTINENGLVKTAIPTDSQIRSGNTSYKPISPMLQHKSVFYGLAKSAGDATQSQSNNAVGTYTDEAKQAIQKMLGIYEAPWELIREDTVTNETADDIIINVDGNGESFELSDLILQIKVPINSNTVIGSYGLVHLFYYTNSDTYIPVMLNSFSGPKPHDWFASVYVKNEKNALTVNYAPYSESGNNRTINVRNQFDFNYGITKIIKILIRNVQGTITYKLYGKRKWN